MNALIVYGSTEGHTRDLCEFVRRALADRGAAVTVSEAAPDAPGPEGFDVCFIAASVHVGRYQTPVTDYAAGHRAALAAGRSAFISVSLSAAGEGPDKWAGLEQCLERFVSETGWTPAAVHHAGGAIRYSHYDFFKRLALKYIAGKRGREAVTTRDYDLTDYEALRAFALGFAGLEAVQ
jgi:menaquinone-dependent protoporphyrinogen oxidase